MPYREAEEPCRKAEEKEERSAIPTHRKLFRWAFVCIGAFLSACLLGPFAPEKLQPFAFGVGTVGVIGAIALFIVGGIDYFDIRDEL